MPSRSRSRSTSRSKKSSTSASKAVKKASRRKSKSVSKRGSKSGSKRVSQAGGKGAKMSAGLGSIFTNLAGVPSIVFAGWSQCGYCRDFLPIWDTFASNPVITDSDIVLSTMTAYNPVPVIPGLADISSFPSIYYTLADGTTMLYNGDRTVDGLIQFAAELNMLRIKDAIAEDIAERIVPTRH